jgi:hypothetical protein
MAARLIEAKAVTLPDVNMQFLPYIAFYSRGLRPIGHPIGPEPDDTGRLLLMPTAETTQGCTQAMRLERRAAARRRGSRVGTHLHERPYHQLRVGNAGGQLMSD